MLWSSFFGGNLFVAFVMRKFYKEKGNIQMKFDEEELQVFYYPHHSMELV